MASKAAKVIVERQLAARKKLWPDVTNEMLWDRQKRFGFVVVPRLMPLIMHIMDGLSEKGFPVGQTYFELWSRLYDELFLTLNRPEEMAFHAGFSGQRALRTWKDRIRRLAELGFIELKPGPLGDLSYAIIFNPFHVIKRAYLQGKVPEDRWRALMIRANEIGAADLDDIDEEGTFIVEEKADEKAVELKDVFEELLATRQKRVKPRPRRRKQQVEA